MNIINAILSVPLGFVIYYAYRLTGNYALAIVIFAFVARALVFPVNILAHKNSIRLLNLQPPLSIIKRRYGNDKEQLHEEQYNLFKKEKYCPYVGLVPLFIQLFLIIGIFGVMRTSEQHIPYLDPGIWGAMPSLTNLSPALLIPVFVGLSALLFCILQSAISPGALSQGKGTNLGLTIFTVALMLYFSLIAPFGLGLYLIAWNLFSVAAVVFLNVLYNPKKLAGEALEYIKSNRKTPDEIRKERLEKKKLRAIEKQDIARFCAAKKQLVFYAISGGQYKYYKNIIEYILEHSDIVIHYLTNDPNDSLFKQSHDKLIPYYIGHNKTIGVMLKLDADMVVTTVPHLQVFHIKRSIVRDDIEYVYVFHGFTSIHMAMRAGAVDYYDTFFCVGPHHVKESRRSEEVYGTPKKRLVKAGYGVFDNLLAAYSNISDEPNIRPQILIAPSWQKDNIMELCIEPVLEQLFGKGFNVIIRPHPEYIKNFKEHLNELQSKYSDKVESGELSFELDFMESASLYLSDIAITDWSNTAYEFSFSTKKPVIFINTPRKVLNPNYTDLGIEPSCIYLRDMVGVSVDMEDLGKFGDIVSDVITNQALYKEKITKTVDDFMYHPGKSGEAGGRYIINRLCKVGDK